MSFLAGYKTYAAAAAIAVYQQFLGDVQNAPDINPYIPLVMVILRQISTTPPGIKVTAFWHKLTGK